MHEWERSREERELLEQARTFGQLYSDLRVVHAAQKIAARYSCADLASLAVTLRKQMVELRDILNTLIVCDACGGAGREGHGESCGRCNGARKVRLWLAAGLEPPRKSDFEE